MKLTIIGGGGFRVPLVYRALLTDQSSPRIDDVTLYDTDSGHLSTIERVLGAQGRESSDAPRVSVCSDLREALRGADFVFCAMRVGGLAGRVVDENVALKLGVLGQETTGAGGIAFALRTVPVALRLAREISEICPDSWVINFTNPAGIITEAMQSVLGERVIGICDSADGLVARAARAAGLQRSSVTADYVGLNHLGWLRALYSSHDSCHANDDETDVLPALLADDDRLTLVEEARLMGLDWIRALGSIPNEYLYFYYCAREAIQAINDAPQTRGAFLQRQQDSFYRQAAAQPDTALDLWQRARRQRDETYMVELRDQARTGDRDQQDIEEGGYEKIAIKLLGSLLRGESQRLILNVRNGDTLPGLPVNGVIEVPCLVDSGGPKPVRLPPAVGHELGLMLQVKEVEQCTIKAARTGSKALARKALALHPLVDSVAVAGQLLSGYLKGSPELAAALPN
ncbi:MAG: 6-phospho-beta-glucosidase [Nakamurella sp.]